MRKILTILFLFATFLSKAQQITYTPMAQAGYGFKYQKSDSGNAMPFRNLSLGRGTDRPGPVIVNIADSGYYYYNGIEFIRLDGKVDSVTSSGNNVCQWKAGVPKCYLLNTGGNTFFGIDSLTYVGNSICWWKTGVPTCYSLIPGVDSVVVTGNQLCEWQQGVPTCYTINGNVLGTGIDSVTVIGTQLCQWTGGVSTCYTINRTSTGIDSLTFQDSILCSWTQGVSTCFNLSRRDTIKVTGNLLTVTYDSTGHQVLGTNHLDGLVSGGTVTLDSCLTIDVTAATFYKNFKLVLTAQILGLAITTPDGTNPRIDFVVADTLGNVSVIAGTPSPTPTGPAFNSGSQIVLASIYVPAAASCLSIMQEIIFDGITDNPSQYNIDTLGVTADFINMDKVFHLNQDLFISKYIDGGTITFTKPADYDTVKAGEIIKTPLSINGAFGNQIYMEFLKDGVAMTSPLLLNSYFSLLDSTEYQIPSVPLSSFTWKGENVFNGVRYTFHGYDTTGAKGLYFDWSQLQIGFSPQIKQYVDSIKVISSNVYYYINGIAYLGGPVGGGGGSETWEQTLINQGSTPFIGDYAVDINHHELDFNNLNIFSANSDDDGSMGLFAGSGGNTFVQIDTNSVQLQYQNVNNSHIKLSNDGIELYTPDADVFIGQRFDGSNTSHVHLFADTSTETPHNTLWLDNDGVVHKGAYGATVPTWQQVLNAGSDINTQSNSVNIGDGSFFFDMHNNLGHAQFVLSPNTEYFIGDGGPDYGMGYLDIIQGGPARTILSPGNGEIQIFATPHTGSPDSVYGVGSDRLTHLYPFSGSSGGSTNLNIGSGFRLAVPGTNNVKTLFCVGCTLDSATNTNALTITVAGSANFAFNENHTGSTSTTITLAHNYLTGTIRVFKNGARIQIPTDYVEATANTITLSSAPLVSDNFTIDFNY